MQLYVAALRQTAGFNPAAARMRRAPSPPIPRRTARHPRQRTSGTLDALAGLVAPQEFACRCVQADQVSVCAGGEHHAAGGGQDTGGGGAFLDREVPADDLRGGVQGANGARAPMASSSRCPVPVYPWPGSGWPGPAAIDGAGLAHRHEEEAGFRVEGRRRRNWWRPARPDRYRRLPAWGPCPALRSDGRASSRPSAQVW